MIFMNKLFPRLYKKDIYDIDYKGLYDRGFRAILFDIDNTLTTHGTKADSSNVAFFKNLRDIGFKTCLISNNKEERVLPFAQTVDSPYIYKANKPSKRGYKKAMELLEVKDTQTAFVGDQIFTDIWGANSAGVYSILVDPISPKEEIQIVLKRYLERIVLFFYKRAVEKGKIMISASTGVYGIVGNPIEHSLSPILQNALAKEMNIDMSYMAFHVKENIKEATDGAYLLGIRGLNVTIPFKKDMLNIVKDIDERAKKIGAVNTLLKTEEGYKGYNTDILGLKYSIENNGLSIKDKNVILLGAGGAAKSALYLAVEEKAKSITVINRNVDRANELKKEVCDTFKYISVIALDELKQNISLLEYDNYFVFQTTDVGMYPNVDKCIIEIDEFYKKCDCGIDLIYTPFETKFIKNMRNADKKCINGLDMLILQGVASFEIWNNVKVNKNIIQKVRLLLVEKLRERMK